MVGLRNRERKVPKASFIAPANIGLRYIMSTKCHSIRDSGYLDVGVLRPNINEDDLKSAFARRSSSVRSCDRFLELTWMVRAMASGSIKGKCRKISEEPGVRLLLPEPFGPATTVKLGFTL